MRLATIRTATGHPGRALDGTGRDTAVETGDADVRALLERAGLGRARRGRGRPGPRGRRAGLRPAGARPPRRSSASG